MSVRFCTYPQEILIQFLQPVQLKQINLLCHEKKIASLIEFYSYYPDDVSDSILNSKKLVFEKLGYIRMDTNQRTIYKAREYRKVYVNTNCLYLKLRLHKNYVNKYNVFNQIGLMSLEFFGNIIYTSNKNENVLNNSMKNDQVKEEDLDEISQEKIRILKNSQDEALKNEDYDEAKKIKKNLDMVRLMARKIYELEIQKKIYINNEDFDHAKILKIEIDRLKANVKNVDKQLNNILPYHNTTFDINGSSDPEESKINTEPMNKESKGHVREISAANVSSFVDKEK